jgi:hypothetical protein
LGQNTFNIDDTNIKFIQYISLEKQLSIKNLYFDKTKWLGCMGCAGIVTQEYIDNIFEKYDFMNVIINIKTRHDREAMERVFALISYLEEIKLYERPSILGNILTDYPYSYSVNWEHYINGFNNNCNIIKIWSGR